MKIHIFFTFSKSYLPYFSKYTTNLWIYSIIQSAKNAYFLYRSVHHHLLGNQLMVINVVWYFKLMYTTRRTVRCNWSHVQLEEGWSVWIGQFIHCISLLNSSHKFSYGGEYMLILETNSVHIVWHDIRQGLVKIMPSKARLEIFKGIMELISLYNYLFQTD